MEERDYLMREIEKLTALIKKIMGLIEGLNFNNFEERIQQINNNLIGQIGLTLDTVSNMSSSEFLSEIKKIDNLNIELFANLLSELSKKIYHIEKETNINSQKLAKKAILTLDYIDENTKTFSIKRMTLKKELQQQIP